MRSYSLSDRCCRNEWTKLIDGVSPPPSAHKRIFKRVRKIGKSDCSLRHVCPSVWTYSPPNGRIFIRTVLFNPLKPNDSYMCRTAPLTSRRCILYIYSTHKSTAYFKHTTSSPFFPLQNAIYFIILHCLVPVLFAFTYRVC